MPVSSTRGGPVLTGLVAAIVLLFSARLPAQTEVDVAMKFFGQGGAYCFRIAPEGTSLSEEQEWTVMVLTNQANRKKEFRIRSMDPGPTGLKGTSLEQVGIAITAIWRRESLREDFFERFSAGISGKTMRARIVKLVPRGIAAMSPRERAELYLKFGDRGSRVNFESGADLSADEFRSLQSYLPD
jgi:hypothetical protein